MRATGWQLLLMMGLCGWSAGAAPQVPPYVESFETYAVGQSMATVPGWSAWDPAQVVISQEATALDALAAYTNAGGVPPLDGPHTRVLASAEYATNAILSLPGHEVEVDLLLRPVFLADLPRTHAHKQAGLYFTTNGQPAVFRHDTLSSSNLWHVLTNSPAIASGAWVRVTLRLNYDVNRYQLRLDGSSPLEDDAGLNDAGDSSPGSWFTMPQTNDHMSALSISGSQRTFLDDLVVRTELPQIVTLPASNVTATAADLRGYLSFTGLAHSAVEVYWGPADGGTNVAGWAHSHVWAAQAPGVFVHTATELPQALHFFRFAASNAYGRSWSPAGETLIPGAVSVLAMDTAAQERPVGTARFTVQRPAWALTGPLTVSYLLSGEATNAIDYEATAGSVTMATGSATADVLITPLRDALVEDTESVILTLQPVGYQVGVPAQAQAEITDSEHYDLIWNNASGDRLWNESSTNWTGASRQFWTGDRAEFVSTPVATGRVYMGQATWVQASQSWTNTTPTDVLPDAVLISAGDYEFEGGTVAAGSVTINGGRVIDRNVSRDGFGGSTISLSNCSFWRFVQPDSVSRVQTLTNTLVARAASVLHGSRGTNNWTGGLELYGRLTVGVAAGSAHRHVFSGACVVNQDTNTPGVRSLTFLDSGGSADLAGPIMDGPHLDGGPHYPLTLATGTLFGDLTLLGTNTHSGGTVVTNTGPTANGVVVAPGSSLGFGDVMVRGPAGSSPAHLNVLASHAVGGTLTADLGSFVWLQAPLAVTGGLVNVHNGASVIITASNAIVDTATIDLRADGFIEFVSAGQVEQVAALRIDGVDLGSGLFGAPTYASHIHGGGFIRVSKTAQKLDALLLTVW